MEEWVVRCWPPNELVFPFSTSAAHVVAAAAATKAQRQPQQELQQQTITTTTTFNTTFIVLSLPPLIVVVMVLVVVIVGWLFVGGSYVCANFGENRSRNATVRVRIDGMTDANRFYNLSHALCYTL